MIHRQCQLTINTRMTHNLITASYHEYANITKNEII